MALQGRLDLGCALKLFRAGLLALECSLLDSPPFLGRLGVVLLHKLCPNGTLLVYQNSRKEVLGNVVRCGGYTRD